jgi:hypothetical protein
MYVPFVHKGGGTHSSVRVERDIELRNNMKKIFLRNGGPA